MDLVGHLIKDHEAWNAINKQILPKTLDITTIVNEFATKSPFLLRNSSILCRISPFSTKNKINLQEYINEVLMVKPGWKDFFENDRVIDEITSIEEVLNDEFERGYTIFPSRHNIFRIFKLLSPDEIKVVILGQDPYISTIKGLKHDQPNGSDKKYTKINNFVFDSSDENSVPSACGLAFSSPLDKVRPSLRNIMAEVKRTEGCYDSSTSGDLISWVAQGVFLLNVLLTCRVEETDMGMKGISNSHKMWKGFAIHVLNYISKVNDTIVIMLWGNEAKIIGNHVISKHHKLESVHPVSRGSTMFIGNGHFRIANKILREKNIKEIDWKLNGKIYDSMYCTSNEDIKYCRILK